MRYDFKSTFWFKGLFIIGSIGKRNAGDDAICLALLNSLQTILHPETPVYLYAKNSEFLCDINKKSNLNIRLSTSFFKVFTSFVKSDLIVIGGGDYIGDCGAASHKIRTYCLFLVLGLITHIFKKKLIMINSGFFVNSGFGLSLLKIILRFTHCVSVRDKNSLNLLSKYANKLAIRGFDTAVLLVDHHKKKIDLTQTGIVNVGFSITPDFYDLTEKQKGLLIKKLANDITLVLTEKNGITLHFLALSKDTKYGDLLMINKIMNLLHKKEVDRTRIISYNNSLPDFMAKFRKLDAVVCCKHHSAVFSHLFEKPMIIVGYHPKNVALADSIMLSTESFISTQDILTGKLYSRIIEIIDNPSQFRARFPVNEAKKLAFNSILECIQYADLYN